MLVDELEHELKSMDNYKTALEPVFSKHPELQLYIKTFILPLSAADCPKWHHFKRLIASGWNPDVSIIPEQGPLMVCLNAYEDILS